MGRSAGFESRAADMNVDVIGVNVRKKIHLGLLSCGGLYVMLISGVYLYECYVQGLLWYWTHWYSPILDFCPMLFVGAWLFLYALFFVVSDNEEVEKKCVL